jgi:hypothetical protein
MKTIDEIYVEKLCKLNEDNSKITPLFTIEIIRGTIFDICNSYRQEIIQSIPSDSEIYKMAEEKYNEIGNTHDYSALVEGMRMLKSKINIS